MKRIFLAAIVATFAAGSAFADDTCESKAVGKDGKPLAGAAKTSFMKKCKADACTPKARRLPTASRSPAPPRTAS